MEGVGERGKGGVGGYWCNGGVKFGLVGVGGERLENLLLNPEGTVSPVYRIFGCRE